MHSIETVVSAADPHRGFNFAELWRYRELVWMLARRDLAVRYRQTAVGVLWAVLQPLVMAGILTLVFGRIARLPSDGQPYALFVLSGWLGWQFFASALQATSMSVVNSPSLVTKVYFPRLVIPLAALGAPLVDYLVATLLLLMLLPLFGAGLPLQALLVPALLALAVATAAGVGCFVAALGVTYRDFRHVLPLLIGAWLFATPVIYPVSMVPQAWRPLLYLNPMAGVVDGLRACWLGLPVPIAGILVSAAVALALLIGGVRFFQVMERRFADVI